MSHRPEVTEPVKVLITTVMPLETEIDKSEKQKSLNEIEHLKNDFTEHYQHALSVISHYKALMSESSSLVWI